MEAGGILTELNRAKVLFQQRALLAALDIPVSRGELREGVINHPPPVDGPKNSNFSHGRDDYCAATKPSNSINHSV